MIHYVVWFSEFQWFDRREQQVLLNIKELIQFAISIQFTFLDYPRKA